MQNKKEQFRQSREICPPPGTGIARFGRYVFRSAGKDGGEFRTDSPERCLDLLFSENGTQRFFTVPSDPIPDGTDRTGADPRTVRTLAGGDLLVVPPGRTVLCDREGLRRGRLFRLTLDFSAPSLLKQSPEGTALLKKTLADPGERVIRPAAPSVPLLTEAFGLLSSEEEAGSYRGCVLLTLFLLRLADLSAVDRIRSAHDPAVLSSDERLSPENREAVVFIRNNLTSPNLNVDAVAKHLGSSRSRMMTGFKREVGMTVHEFILQSKAESARSLLMRFTVTETALLLNFSSSQHFSKVFREQTGYTPTEFRKRRESSRSGPG